MGRLIGQWLNICRYSGSILVPSCTFMYLPVSEIILLQLPSLYPNWPTAMLGIPIMGPHISWIFGHFWDIVQCPFVRSCSIVLFGVEYGWPSPVIFLGSNLIGRVWYRYSLPRHWEVRLTTFLHLSPIWRHTGRVGQGWAGLGRVCIRNSVDILGKFMSSMCDIGGVVMSDAHWWPERIVEACGTGSISGRGCWQVRKKIITIPLQKETLPKGVWTRAIVVWQDSARCGEQHALRFLEDTPPMESV